MFQIGITTVHPKKKHIEDHIRNSKITRYKLEQLKAGVAFEFAHVVLFTFVLVFLFVFVNLFTMVLVFVFVGSRFAPTCNPKGINIAVINIVHEIMAMVETSICGYTVSLNVKFWMKGGVLDPLLQHS
jgi:hypothetical protein